MNWRSPRSLEQDLLRRFRSAVGNELRKIRKANNLTQAQLAARLGWDWHFVNNYENGAPSRLYDERWDALVAELRFDGEMLLRDVWSRVSLVGDDRLEIACAR